MEKGSNLYLIRGLFFNLVETQVQALNFPGAGVESVFLGLMLYVK